MTTQEILKEKIQSLRKEIGTKQGELNNSFLEKIADELSIEKSILKVTARNYSYETEIRVSVRLIENHSENFEVIIFEKRDWDDITKVTSKTIEVSSYSLRFKIDEVEGLNHVRLLSEMTSFFKENEKEIWKDVDAMKKIYYDYISGREKEIRKLEDDIKTLDEKARNKELANIEKEYIKEGQDILVSNSTNIYSYPLSARKSARYIKLGKVNKVKGKVELYYKEYAYAKSNEYFKQEYYEIENMEKKNVKIEDVVKYIHNNKDKYITYTTYPKDKKGNTDYNNYIYHKAKRIGFDFDTIGTNIEDEIITKEEYNKIRNISY